MRDNDGSCHESLAGPAPRVRRERSRRQLADELEQIANHCAGLVVLDDGSADEMLGYERGLPRVMV